MARGLLPPRSPAERAAILRAKARLDRLALYPEPVDIGRVRVLHTSADDMQPTWEEIASRWSDVPPPPDR